jgi:probable phosphoglycerate mutase
MNMRTTEILLLRHGQSEGNENGRFGGHGPTPLTQKGHAQAAAAARAIAAEGGLTAIFASDLVRAVETARPVVEATGIAMVQTPALRERSVGVFTGLTFDEAAERYPADFAALMARDSEASPPDGETAVACTARAAELVEQVIAKFIGGRLLFVSHAATLNLVLLHLLGLPHRDHGRRLWFRTDNCAIHRLRRGSDDMWQIVALNDRTHLADLSTTHK